ncbi:CpsB/CapC family capsule biosynthesis tyrosine phosphatase [Ruminococcus sp.]|uniref:CpsB/CapC family capsule biosynthesis tyrosine phosphatase n=1 Tax=Ruminococcus sp. TaxID=41978 RepID=UPI0025CE275E|nr:CpsB/CapC family capsule biosynthesis tyrosine phosphatase [Ruminococcus sp.]MBQ8967299.1 histidinol-phosphatase [Ruminococcus sp.]
MLIDFHSHFLPQIDDGSRNIEESVGILDIMAENDTDIIIATPHFYCTEQSVEKFLERRDHAYERLKPHLKEGHPRIGFGAEVLYDHSLVNYDKLPDLCIRGTKWLLLEMPYTDLDDKILDGVEAITNRGDLKVLVAHIERYLNFTSMKRLDELMSMDLIGQINAKSLTSFKTKRRCMKLIEKGYVQVLGSDYHRIGRGDVTVNHGFEIITKNKKFDDFAEYAEENGMKILKDESLSSIR